MTGGENDNKDIVMLGEEFFAKAINIELRERIRNNKTRDTKLIEVLEGRKISNGPTSFGDKKDWANDEGILLYKDKVYVPPDEALQRKIVKTYHDPPVMGHPGIQKTYELVSREYFWPGMRNFITQYVRGCATCQTSKVNTNPTKAGTIPIPHSGDTQPFRRITMDYITGLPESNGFDAIQVVVDHDVTKAVVISPCTTKITAMGAAELLWKDVFSHYGIPEQIISD